MSVAVEFQNYLRVILITITLSYKKSHIFTPFDFLSDFVCNFADIYICCELFKNSDISICITSNSCLYYIEEMEMHSSNTLWL